MTGYAQPLSGAAARARAERSRICTVTGLRVYAGAQALTVANAVAAVLALAAGGLFGMLIGFSRAPGWEILGPGTFYAALTGHGVGALILWPIFFEVAAMVFASSILLNARVFSMKLGWVAFGLMCLGSVLLLGVILAGHASVGFTAYPPLVANQVFYLGYLIFAVGVLIAIANFSLSIVAARNDETFTGSLPLITYGVACAAILALGATTLALAPILFAVVLFLWTPSHFWSLAIVYENDYRAAGIPMLPAVVGAQGTASAVHANTLVLVAASLALAPLLGIAYGVVAVLAGAAFLRDTHALREHADKRHAWRTFKASGLYLLALLVGLILSTL